MLITNYWLRRNLEEEALMRDVLKQYCFFLAQKYGGPCPTDEEAEDMAEGIWGAYEDLLADL